MSEIVPFNFDGAQVRVIIDLEDRPWWVAADVCAVLDITNPSDAIRRLDQADLGTTEVRSQGQTRHMRTVNESGLYDLVLDSRKPEARKFRRWITSEVLPSIRQTGVYGVAKPTSQIDILRAALDQIEAAQQVAEQARREVTEVAHRVDALEGNHGWYSALAYAKKRGWVTEAQYLNRLGRIAGQIGRRAGLRAAKVPHPVYAEVNAWPEWVWEHAHQETADGMAG